ncbi:MAG: hypothetical protein ABIN97_13465 [Ginsengibacter sp.]
MTPWEVFSRASHFIEIGLLIYIVKLLRDIIGEGIIPRPPKPKTPNPVDEPEKKL